LTDEDDPRNQEVCIYRHTRTHTHTQEQVTGDVFIF
jgi:hypothetical protein